jgi:hypothetical protein
VPTRVTQAHASPLDREHRARHLELQRLARRSDEARATWLDARVARELPDAEDEAVATPTNRLDRQRLRVGELRSAMQPFDGSRAGATILVKHSLAAVLFVACTSTRAPAKVTRLAQPVPCLCTSDR